MRNRYLAPLLLLVFAGTADAANDLVLSGTTGGAEIFEAFIDSETFYAQFVEYDGSPFFKDAPVVAQATATDVIPVPYPESQEWIITEATAVDFALDWSAIEAAFADPFDLMLLVGVGIHPLTEIPFGVAGSTFGRHGIRNGAFTRHTIIVDGVTIQTGPVDPPHTGPIDRPSWQLVTMDVEELHFERVFYDWETCDGRWCFGEPFEGLHALVRWTIVGNGELAAAAPPPEPSIPEPSTLALIWTTIVMLSGSDWRRRGR